ncbi:MAG: low molecular weight protein-tyrosine-phosphatase [Rickettsiales bacterium]
MVHKLLFVCTGNICRSPTMEGTMRHLVRQHGLEEEFELDSAGTHDYHVGDAPDHRSIKTAAKYGVDISDLVARRVHPDDFETYDLLLAADRGHYTLLKELAPKKSAAKIQLFLPYSRVSHREEVPDPYYGPAQGFDDVFRLIEEGCNGLLQRLHRI